MTVRGVKIIGPAVHVLHSTAVAVARYRERKLMGRHSQICLWGHKADFGTAFQNPPLEQKMPKSAFGALGLILEWRSKIGHWSNNGMAFQNHFRFDVLTDQS